MRDECWVRRLISNTSGRCSGLYVSGARGEVEEETEAVLMIGVIMIKYDE